MPKAEQEYRNFSIPTGLVALIERTLKELKDADTDVSYGSVAEFVKEAVRYRIEELRRLYLPLDSARR